MTTINNIEIGSSSERRTYWKCWACGCGQARIVKIETKHEDLVCVNPECWRYVNIINLKTWSKIISTRTN